MKKTFVYTVWGMKYGEETVYNEGLYWKEDDAWKRYAELWHGVGKLQWKWLDVKKMEVK